MAAARTFAFRSKDKNQELPIKVHFWEGSEDIKISFACSHTLFDLKNPLRLTGRRMQEGELAKLRKELEGLKVKALELEGLKVKALELEELRVKYDALVTQVPVASEDTKAAATQRPKYVASISACADEHATRNVFRQALVSESNVRGAFVAHDFYIEFVKSVRRLAPDGEWKDKNQAEKRWMEVTNALSDRANVLFEPIPSDDYTDAENPQSGILAELIRHALTLWEENHDIFVQHQLEISYMVDLAAADIIESTKKAKSAQQSKTSASIDEDKTTDIGPNQSSDAVIANNLVKDKAKRKVSFVADVAIWLQRDKKRHFLALVEYKPDQRNAAARKAQIDMCVANVLERNGEGVPCIAVDVAGGHDVTHWSIGASAIVRNPEYPGVTPRYIKSSLMASFLQGKGEANGVDGILRLVVGLLHARSAFFHEPNKQLGPAVAHSGKMVVKAYDDSTYCRPNIALVREMVDANAKIWVRKRNNKRFDETCQLLEMKFIESDWHAKIPVKNFIRLLSQTERLHAKGVAHGDIRQSNMRSSGYLIDFDFVGNQYYPRGLQEIGDGQRHSDVIKAISESTVGNLKMEICHDLHSMWAVMLRFAPDDEALQAKWEDACKILASNKKAAIREAIQILRELEESTVSLYPVFTSFSPDATGGTPGRNH
jgi:hypothetical protein